MLTLFLVLVHEVGEFERCLSILLSKLFHFIDIVLPDLSNLMKNVAHERTFARVYVTNDNNVDVFL
jgi:hypothetical protein